MNLTPRNPLIEGVTVTINGQAYIVAPFNIKRSKDTGQDRAALRAATSLDSAEAIGAMVHIAGVALRANYPDLTDESLEEELKLDDLSTILRALGKANNGGEEESGEPAGTASAETLAPPTGTA